MFTKLARSRGRVAGPLAALLHSPPVAGRTADLGAYIRFESTLRPADRELAVLAVARERDCRFEWAAHVPGRGARVCARRPSRLSARAPSIGSPRTRRCWYATRPACSRRGAVP